MDKQKVIDRLVMLVAVVAIAFGAYFYYQWNLIRQNPQAVAEREVANLVATVTRLIDLPTDETPTVATVSDPEALRSQAFFAKAEVGDKVLIYTKAKKAILYSVTKSKILEVAPLNIGSGQGSGTSN